MTTEQEIQDLLARFSPAAMKPRLIGEKPGTIFTMECEGSGERKFAPRYQREILVDVNSAKAFLWLPTRYYMQLQWFGLGMMKHRGKIYYEAESVIRFLLEDENLTISRLEQMVTNILRAFEPPN